LSLRHRHGYHAALHRGLPTGIDQTRQGVPRPNLRMGTHRIRPRSARFEPVDD